MDKTNPKRIISKFLFIYIFEMTKLWKSIARMKEGGRSGKEVGVAIKGQLERSLWGMQMFCMLTLSMS